MVRFSKQARRRMKSPHRTRPPAKKTGPMKDNLENGYKMATNALEGDLSQMMFIPKIK